MTAIKYTLYFIFFQILLLWSCQTVVEVELPEHEPKLVVNAVFNPDSLFTVDVSVSQSAFSNDTHMPEEDAVVGLYQAEEHLFDLQHKGNGIYQADHKPEALQYYELKVSAPGYPNAGAVSYIPAKPLIYDVEASIGPTFYDWQGPTVDASFTLEDTPEEENFYYLEVFSPDTNFRDISYNKYITILSSSPVEFEFSMETRFFFSDKLFDGQALRLKLNLQNSPEYMTQVQVAHITREYYQYVRTLSKQSYNDNINLTPIAVNNNIRGGMGLFAGCNVTTLMIKP